MNISQRLLLAWAVLTGRFSPTDQTETEMELKRVKAQVDELNAALARAASQQSSLVAENGKLTADNTDLQQQLTDAESQIVELLQPAVDAADALAPAPQAQ
jgi:peptidoglycan hydrolase CwlO-like protein